MNESTEERIPQTQSAFSGGPPRPPKITARGLEDQPDDPGRTIYIPDPVEIKVLAMKLGLKPFRIVAEALQLGQFKHADEMIDFQTAWLIAQKHGYDARLQETFID